MPVLTGLPIYYENPVGRLYEHPDGYAIVDYNPGARQLDTFRAFLQHLENLLRRHGWNKILADHRQLAPFTDEEHHYLHEHWLQVSHAVEEQLRAAILIPADLLAHLPDQQPEEGRVGIMVYHLFSDAKAGASWLLQAF